MVLAMPRLPDVAVAPGRRLPIIPTRSLTPRDVMNRIGTTGLPTTRSVLQRGPGLSLPGIENVMAMVAPQFAQGFSDVFGAGAYGQVGAPFSPTGPSFAGGMLDDAANDINAAAAKYGIPANFLAAVIARESTGNWNRDGNRYVYLPDRGHYILPYVGMTDPAVRQFGIDPRSLIGNRAGQIDVLARNLRRIYDQYGDWEVVANVHYSGDPTGRSTPGDSWQYGSTQHSTNMIMSFWRQLEPGANPKAAGSPLGGATGGGFDMIFGGQSYPTTQEMGLTNFARQHLGGMYSYATNYGVQGHAGIDIGTPIGTQLYSPVAGTVITAGGTNYYTDDRYGRGAPGSGELKIKLDNGDELILGHMGRINVQVGQRVQPGQLVGLSGTANGPHVHVEYRQYTPGKTPSGFTAVDPRTALGSLPGGSLMGGSQLAMPRTLGSSFADPARLVFDPAFRAQYA